MHIRFALAIVLHNVSSLDRKFLIVLAYYGLIDSLAKRRVSQNCR